MAKRLWLINKLGAFRDFIEFAFEGPEVAVDTVVLVVLGLDSAGSLGVTACFALDLEAVACETGFGGLYDGSQQPRGWTWKKAIGVNCIPTGIDCTKKTFWSFDWTSFVVESRSQVDTLDNVMVVGGGTPSVAERPTLPRFLL
jgi:hypothetical protein